MKIAIFGIIPFTDLIKEGFIKLGHEISNNNPDLIFANDPVGYQDAAFLKMQYPKTQLILNVLDIPWHFPNIENQIKIHLIILIHVLNHNPITTSPIKYRTIIL